MKKAFLVLSFLVRGLSAMFADEFVVSRIGCSNTRTLYDEEIVLKYDDKEEVFYLFRSKYSKFCWYTFTPEKLEKLREIVKKAQEWSALAEEKKTAVTKEIPNSTIRVPVTMKWGNDWYTSSYDMRLNFMFISSFDSNNGLTSLIISGIPVSSVQNRYTELEFESIVFINSMLDKLADAISDKAVKVAIEEQKKKQSDAFMFK